MGFYESATTSRLKIMRQDDFANRCNVTVTGTKSDVSCKKQKPHTQEGESSKNMSQQVYKHVKTLH